KGTENRWLATRSLVTLIYYLAIPASVSLLCIYLAQYDTLSTASLYICSRFAFAFIYLHGYGDRV
ncbi:hypothetical protein B0H19DRAFT_1104061, partial [Mycena capillaripes]